jgi:hypothetical protein
LPQDVNRRQFLAWGGGAMYLWSVRGPTMLGGAPLGVAPQPHVSLTVYDNRFAAGHIFARSFYPSVRTVGSGGDMTQVWSSEIAPLLVQRTAIAGLTMWPGFICLAEMCRTIGMTGRFVGRHLIGESMAQHRLSGSTAIVSRISNDPAMRSNWPTAVARALLDQPSLARPRASAILRFEHQRAGDSAADLVSWVIA